MPTCSASATELAVYLIVRGEAFYRKTFFTCQCVATLLGVLLPLFITNTPSHGAARKSCHDWTFMLNNATHWDVDSPDYNPEWEMEDSATFHLFPQHLYNSISTVVSLFGFWVWIFFSPHMADVARDLSLRQQNIRDLDRTCTKLDCISALPKTRSPFLMLPPSSCLMISYVLLYSRQLFCPSVVVKPPRCCDSVRAKLRAIRNSKNGSYVGQHARDFWAVRHSDEPPVPSLLGRKGARHDQTVRQS